MSPILGIYASQMSGHLWPASSYESIATTTVGAGGVSSVTFSSIPSTYTHLQVRAIAKDNRAAVGTSIDFRFNGDSGSNYTTHFMWGSNATTGTGSDISISTGLFIRTFGATAVGGSSTLGSAIIDILDYANTNKKKTIRGISSIENNNSTESSIWVTSALWNSTSAISSITLTPTGTLISQYSSFALYGIKGV